MIAERHYDDELLISFLGNSAALARDPHLSSCRTCTETLTSFRTIAETLGQEAVWDLRDVRTEEAPAVASTVANLRAYADEMSREDAQAEQWLEHLLAGPRDTWMPRLLAHPHYRTAGMVRKLVAATDRAIDTMPPDAVTLTELATEIADHLPPFTYASDTVAKLRGAAWRERAYALFYVGRFNEAEPAVAKAETHFGECVVSEYDLARVGIVRALVERAMERLDVGSRVAQQSAATFENFSDVRGFASARLAEAQMLFKLQQHKEALDLLERLNDRFGTQLDADTRARVLTSIAICRREAGQSREAIELYQIVDSLFTELDTPTECARIRWNVAVLLLSQACSEDAIRRLDAVIREFESLGMRSEAAVARLDLAEAFVTRGEYARAEDMCHEAIHYFRDAGLPYGTRACTAVALLQEAARERRATVALVRDVKRYIRALPARPALLFAPAPSQHDALG
jgi:tetratricopeptide (TPR) repeat protein